MAQLRITTMQTKKQGVGWVKKKAFRFSHSAENPGVRYMKDREQYTESLKALSNLAQVQCQSLKTLLQQSPQCNEVLCFVQVYQDCWLSVLKVFGVQNPWNLTETQGQGTSVYIFAFFSVSGERQQHLDKGGDGVIQATQSARLSTFDLSVSSSDSLSGQRPPLF